MQIIYRKTNHYILFFNIIDLFNKYFILQHVSNREINSSLNVQSPG
jgi:hypothetical protein